MVGAITLAALTAAALLSRRRRPAMDRVEDEPAPIAPTPPTSSPAPSPALAEPAPVPPPIAPAPQPDTDRPRLDLILDIKSARLTLMGATISYVLAVHNRGTLAADDILIRALLANAGTAQQATLDQFLDGSIGMPAHSIVSLAPGEGQWLTGELRIASQDIAPLQVGDRALLVPLALFDAHYRWSDTQDAHLARSFLVGQAPAQDGDRLAPLRLDLGPRQYRDPAARAVGDLLNN